MTDKSAELGDLKYAGAVKTHAFTGAGALSLESVGGALRQPPEFRRADIVVEGVDHSGPSFEVRLFGNNTAATAATPTTIENGYLGSFNVFGHGFCFGDVGHCEVTKRGQAETDLRDPHPLNPMQKIVVATDAIKTLIARDGGLKDVSLVPIAIGTQPKDEKPDQIPEVLK